MANGFLTALQETESSLAEWRMASPEHTSIEWLISLHSRWRMAQEWNLNFNLYTHMKKSTKKNLFGFVGLASLFIACSEAETMLFQYLWSGSWIFIAALCAIGVGNNLTDEEKEEQV